MIKLECDVWEQKQLSEYLQYAKKKLFEECNEGKITALYLEIEIKKLDNLLRVVHGKGEHDYLYDSSAYRMSHSDYNGSNADKEIWRIPEL